MKDNEIIIAVAELDGWEHYPQPINNQHCVEGKHPWFDTNSGCCYHRPKAYLTSRDAIIPVIEKQDYDTKNKIVQFAVTNFFDGWYEKQVANVLCATPRQLCIALLKATGKWKD